MLNNMVLKTFNLDEETHRRFAEFCRENGISMSKQIDLFIRSQIEDEPEVRPEYVKKLRKIEKEGKFISFKNIGELRKRIENA
jgi:antitoxin component of RelBE/YafQ-DinJ toxin-antitoxin module